MQVISYSASRANSNPSRDTDHGAILDPVSYGSSRSYRRTLRVFLPFVEPTGGLRTHFGGVVNY